MRSSRAAGCPLSLCLRLPSTRRPPSASPTRVRLAALDEIPHYSERVASLERVDGNGAAVAKMLDAPLEQIAHKVAGDVWRLLDCDLNQGRT